MARYDAEFKRQAVEAYATARPDHKSDREALRAVAAEFNIPANSLRDWVKAGAPVALAAAGPVAREVPATKKARKPKPEPSNVVVLNAGDLKAARQASADGSLGDAYESAVSDMPWLHESDAALVEVGRKIAENVDGVLNDFESDAYAKTKALYLAPHLVNVLRELGGTPESRKALTAGGEKVAGKLAALRAGENKRATK